jgi:hypothetical protein
MTGTEASPALPSDTDADPIVVDLRHPAAESYKVLQRERTLKELLDPPLYEGVEMDYDHCPNYEYAKDSGLIDMFYYNPETGQDAIVHILAGDVVRNRDTGYTEVSGYHLESAARDPETYVDHEAIAQKSSNSRRNFQERPFEPYKTQVVIKGYPKMVLHRKPDGTYDVEAASSSMYPHQYDALAVLQAIRIARDERDRSLDEHGPDNRVIAHGFAPLLDGETLMPVQLWLEEGTDIVHTAFPAATPRHGYMNLTPEAIKQHLGLSE